MILRDSRCRLCLWLCTQGFPRKLAFLLITAEEARALYHGIVEALYKVGRGQDV